MARWLNTKFMWFWRRISWPALVTSYLFQREIKYLPHYFQDGDVAVQITPGLISAHKNSWFSVPSSDVPTIRQAVVQALGVATLDKSPESILCSSEQHRIWKLQAVRSPIQLCTFPGGVARLEGPAFRGLKWQQEPARNVFARGHSYAEIANPGLVFRN